MGVYTFIWIEFFFFVKSVCQLRVHEVQWTCRSLEMGTAEELDVFIIWTNDGLYFVVDWKGGTQAIDAVNRVISQRRYVRRVSIVRTY